MSIIKPGKPIGIACDHAGYELKQYLLEVFKQKKIEVVDYGTHSPESCDYADCAHPLAEAIERGDVYPGVAICGSGNGINITLNKHQGVRSALCWSVEIARMARLHNDANVLVMPGRYITKEEGMFIVDTFLNTEFEGGRHQIRVDKIPVKK